MMIGFHACEPCRFQCCCDLRRRIAAHTVDDGFKLFARLIFSVRFVAYHKVSAVQNFSDLRKAFFKSRSEVDRFKGCYKIIAVSFKGAVLKHRPE